MGESIWRPEDDLPKLPDTQNDNKPEEISLDKTLSGQIKSGQSALYYLNFNGDSNEKIQLHFQLTSLRGKH